MQPFNQDWEGFQSEHQPINIFPLKNTHHLISNVPGNTESHQNQSFRNHRIITRSTNKRKNSIITSEKRKSSKDSQSPQINIQNKKLQLQRTRIIIKIQEQKQKQREQPIPVFRQQISSLTEDCKIIYKGFQPKRAEQYLQPRKEQAENETSDLLFNSDFQSGNLQLVYKCMNEYHLHVAADTNTKGHRQWFFFSVKARYYGKKRLFIHSFKKRLSLFQIGMKPYGKKKDQPLQSWRAMGENVHYLRQDFRTNKHVFINQQQFFICFDLELQPNVVYQIASCIPYTYSYLQQRLQTMALPALFNLKCEYSTLCKSLIGLDIPLITINETKGRYNAPYIIINARTHPGETSASWVLDGFLEELSNSRYLQKLIVDTGLVIKVIPMLNAQGVYMGNYRTGVMGVDFNRLFLTGKAEVFPQVVALKDLVRQCKEKGNIDLYLDLHGHSILPGCFAYGPHPHLTPKSALKHFVKELKTSKYFSQRNCIMDSDIKKIETSRIFFQLQEEVHAVTLENSLGLFKEDQKGKDRQMHMEDWQHFGRDILKSILKIYDTTQQKGKNILGRTLDLTKTLQIDDFQWQRTKTDNGSIIQVKNIQEIQIQIPLSYSQNAEPVEIDSLNDSDNDSDNISQDKQRQLFQIASRVTDRHRKLQKTHFRKETLQSKETNSKRQKRSTSRGQIISFKEYRFGFEESTLNEWYERRRLLSAPKPLKKDNLNKSYIIRRSTQQQFNKLHFNGYLIETGMRLKSQQNFATRRMTLQKYCPNSKLINRQKAAVLYQLLNHKN